jgi:hypothetical protein
MLQKPDGLRVLVDLTKRVRSEARLDTCWPS